jgi:GMP synthase (glutamine-hydrolysing)
MSENKEILIIKNIPREDKGLLGHILREHGILNRVIDAGRMEPLNSVESYGAVIVFGGPASANDTSPEMIYELGFIRKVLEAGIPYLGICLGLQTMVKAAGGDVIKSPVKEIGFRNEEGQFYNVELTESGRKDPLFEEMEDSLEVFHLHGETVLLTEKMNLLAKGRNCTNQIVKIGENAYGIQCHFELTEEMFEEWITEDPDLLELDREQLRSDFLSVGLSYTERGYRLFRNFLRVAGYKV